MKKKVWILGGIPKFVFFLIFKPFRRKNTSNGTQINCLAQ